MIGALNMKEEEKEEEEVIVERAYARVGLLGNPSDIYHGRTLAFAVKQFQASVTLTPNARREDSTVRVIPNEGLDLLSHSSIGEAHTTLRDRGFHGGTRLLLALLKVFVEQCKQKGIALTKTNPRLSQFHQLDISPSLWINIQTTLPIMRRQEQQFSNW